MNRRSHYPQIVDLRAKERPGLHEDPTPITVIVTHESERYFTGMALQDRYRESVLWSKQCWQKVAR